jgi:5'-deoxynucleotidase YfbR-like HD superfamily hydrolase
MLDTSILQPHARVLQHVPRWSIIRILHQQSVAEHSFYVTLYTTYICELLDYDIETTLFATRHAMTHDFRELITGDIPSPYNKNQEPYTSPASDRMMAAIDAMSSSIAVHISAPKAELCYDVVSLADVYEATMFLMDEISMGNKGVSRLASKMKTITLDMARDLGGVELEGVLCKHIENPVRTRVCNKFGLE